MDTTNWLGVVLLVLFLIAGLLVYYQLIFPQEVTRKTLKNISVLYVEHQCRYEKLGGPFNRMMKDTNEVIPNTEATGIGFYFDKYPTLKNKHLARASIGIILGTDEDIRRAEDFVARCHRFKIAHLPSVVVSLNRLNHCIPLFTSGTWCRTS